MAITVTINPAAANVVPTWVEECVHAARRNWDLVQEDGSTQREQSELVHRASLGQVMIPQVLRFVSAPSSSTTPAFSSLRLTLANMSSCKLQSPIYMSCLPILSTLGSCAEQVKISSTVVRYPTGL